MSTIPSAVDRIASADVSTGPKHYGLRSVLGLAAWTRLPEAVRVRFGEPPAAVDYAGEFDVVRASWLGRLGALACRVRSTKIIDSRGGPVERLPARLGMPLNVYERHGVLHFVSRGYYFDFGKR